MVNRANFEAQSVQLLNDYLRTNDNEFLMKLYNLHSGLFHKIALDFSAYMEMDDLMQECFIGLVKTVNGYDYSKGEFIGYLSSTIHSHLYRAIQGNQNISIPEYMQPLISKYFAILEEAEGKKVSDDYMAYKLGTSVETVVSIKKAISGRSCFSMDAPITEDGATIGDITADEYDMEESCLDDLFSEEIQMRVRECLKDTPEDDRKLLMDRYIDGKSFAEIDRSKSVARNRQKVEMAFRRFKRRNAPKLRPLYDEIMLARAYNRSLNSVTRFKRTWESSVEAVVLKAVSDADSE